MTTHWRETGPEGYLTPPVLDVTEECCPPDSGGAVLLFSHGGLPDRVRQPAELGGRELLVLGHTEVEFVCPSCGAEGSKDALVLEDEYGAAICGSCRQYVWFRRTQREEEP